MIQFSCLIWEKNPRIRHADDTEHTAVDIVTEFHHIQAWATANKLCINTKKTKEIVLHQPRARSHYIPLSIDEVERVINRIQALLKRLFKFGYSSQLLSFHDLITSCSKDLFDNAHISNHCLHELLSSYVHRLESLRPRGHDLVLPTCTSYLHKRSFLVRALFEFI